MRSSIPRSFVDQATEPAESDRHAGHLPAGHLPTGHLPTGRWLTTLVLVLVLVLALSSQLPTALAQEPGDPGGVFSGSVAVKVTNIEVFVTNSRGVPVTGLEAADFEVLEDGEPVEITNFYAVHNGEVEIRSETPPDEAGPASGEQAEAARSTASEPPTRMNLVVFVDLMFSRSKTLATSLAELKTFLEKNLNENDRVMVVAFTGSIQVLAPLSTDHEAAIEAIKSLRGRAGQGDLLDAEAAEVTAIGAMVPSDNLTQAMIDQVAKDKISSLAEERRLLTRRAMRGLQATVATLAAGCPGRKAILMVSDGAPANPLQGESEVYTTGIIGPNRSIRATPRGLLDVVALANATGVTLYTVAAGGLTQGNPTGVILPDVPGQLAYGGGADQLRRNSFAASADSTNSLDVLAAGTGGVSIIKPSPSTLRVIADDLGSYYSIGFRSHAAGTGQGDEDDGHRLDVRVKDRRLKVRHRRWYQAMDQRDRLAGRTLAALEVPAQDNSIGLTCEPAASAHREGKKLVAPLTLRFVVARVGMVPSGAEWLGRLRIFMVARQKGGDLSPIKELTVPLRLSQAAFADEHLKRFSLKSELPLEPGTVTIAITAYDEVAETASTITTEIELDPSGRILGGRPAAGVIVQPPEPVDQGRPSGAEETQS